MESALKIVGNTMKKQKIPSNEKDNLTRMRLLVNILIKQLEGSVAMHQATPGQWGEEEERVLAVLTKITALFDKILSMEKKFLTEEEEPEKKKKKGRGVLSKEDTAIIRRYLERQAKIRGQKIPVD